MKRFCTTLLSLSILGCTAPTIDFQSSPEPRIEVLSDHIVIDGTTLKLPIDIPALETVLGPASRTVSKSINAISTWDSHGLYACVRPDGRYIHDISASYQDEEFHFSPSSAFAGTLKIDDFIVHSGVNRKLLLRNGFQKMSMILTALTQSFSIGRSLSNSYLKTR